MRMPALPTCLLSIALSGIVVTAAPARLVAQYPDDPRMVPPAPPTTAEQFEARFLTRYQPVGEPRALMLSEAEMVRFAQPVVQGVCYAAAGIGVGISDLDITVRAANGIVGQDVYPDGYPLAVWCALDPGEVQVEVTAFTGAGTARVGIWAVPESVMMADGPFDELSNRLLLLQSRATPGWVPAAPQWRGRLGQPGTVDFAFAAEAGVCYAALGIGAASIYDLDLAIFDAAGQEVDGDYSVDPTGAVLVCAQSASEWTVRAFGIAGRGGLAVQLLRPPEDWAVPAPAAPGSPGP